MYWWPFFNPIIFKKLCYIFDQYMLDLLSINQQIDQIQRLTYGQLKYWHGLYDVILKAHKDA